MDSIANQHALLATVNDQPLGHRDACSGGDRRSFRLKGKRVSAEIAILFIRPAGEGETPCSLLPLGSFGFSGGLARFGSMCAAGAA